MLQGGGTVVRQHTVAGNSRHTIVAGEQSQVGADQAFSTKLVSDQNIIVERAMYFDGGGHNTIGVKQNSSLSFDGLTLTLARGVIADMDFDGDVDASDITALTDDGTNVIGNITAVDPSLGTITLGTAIVSGSEVKVTYHYVTDVFEVD